MQHDTIYLLKAVKYGAAAFGLVTVAGIVTLMYISLDKDEDIAGIVAPASLLVILSTLTAIAAAFLQRRRERSMGRL